MTNNENGRSMVEMLGVLAIIGVLSVTGIVGYTMAMRSFRANEALEGASLLYTSIQTADGSTITPATYSNATTAEHCYTKRIGGVIPGNATNICYTGTNEITIGAANEKDAQAIRNKVGTTGPITAGGTDPLVVLTYNIS